MRTAFLFAYLLSQADIDAGKANNIPAGSPIFVIDGNGVPTGKEYCSTGSSAPTEAVTGANINTVLSAAGGAGWVKVQATTSNYAITRPTTGAGLDLHIESGGSLAALTSTAWPVPASGVDQLRIRNFSGSARTFSAGADWTIVTADGNPVTGGSYSIPDDRAVEVTLDPDGFAQVVPWGGEVSVATFNTHTGNVSNPHIVTKAQVSLGNVDNTSDVNKIVSTAQQTVFDTKEPKVTGKGLSTNDYTTTEKNKLAGVAANATQNDTDANLKARANHTGTQAPSTVTGLDAALTAREQTANRNIANGYAGLDSGGKVAAAQLPSYVDDVIEVANLAALPGTGTAGIIYVTLDTNKPYRWSGSAYVEISPSPGSTDSVTEGSANLYFTAARAKAAAVANAIVDGVTDVAPSQNAVFDAMAAKQATLVSGQNLSSVNGLSLLGGGDITMAADLPGGTLTPVIDEGLDFGNATPDRVTVPGQTILKYLITGATTFTPPIGVSNVRVLVVAGGGGGGVGVGGGGGAGGVLASSSEPVSGSITVTIGNGGQGRSSDGAGANGGNSVFGSVTATGGGGGGGWTGAGVTGGSGGGGNSGNAANPAVAVAGNGTIGQGNNGGAGIFPLVNAMTGGGGGGAGAVGAGGGTLMTDGVGGIGVSSDITGTAILYGGGGGAGLYQSGTATSPRPGGNGGGGAGNGFSIASVAGTANTGGGGGGNQGSSSGAGGSGIIIIRFATQTRNYIALTSYADNAAARAAGKLIGQFFKLTSTNAVMQVV